MALGQVVVSIPRACVGSSLKRVRLRLFPGGAVSVLVLAWWLAQARRSVSSAPRIHQVP